jgi:hypothetical protein
MTPRAASRSLFVMCHIRRNPICNPQNLCCRSSVHAFHKCLRLRRSRAPCFVTLCFGCRALFAQFCRCLTASATLFVAARPKTFSMFAAGVIGWSGSNVCDLQSLPVRSGPSNCLRCDRRLGCEPGDGGCNRSRHRSPVLRALRRTRRPHLAPVAIESRARSQLPAHHSARSLGYRRVCRFCVRMFANRLIVLWFRSELLRDIPPADLPEVCESKALLERHLLRKQLTLTAVFSHQ